MMEYGHWAKLAGGCYPVLKSHNLWLNWMRGKIARAPVSQPVSIMNEIKHFKCPKGMFSLIEATYQRYYRGASETDFLLLIFILYHLREQIVGGQKYNQIKSINPQDRTPAQNLFMELWELDEFQIIRGICNGTKHHKIENDLSQIEKARAGIARSGDSLDHKYYLIDGVDSRNIFTTILLKYKNYFNREKC